MATAIPVKNVRSGAWGEEGLAGRGVAIVFNVFQKSGRTLTGRRVAVKRNFASRMGKAASEDTAINWQELTARTGINRVFLLTALENREYTYTRYSFICSGRSGWG